MLIDAILLDDDPWVRAEWQSQGKKYAKNIFVSESFSEIALLLGSLPKDIPLFIDVELGPHVNCLQILRDLSAEGFTNIFLATAHASTPFQFQEGVKGLIGKDPPAWLLAPVKASQKLSKTEQTYLFSKMSGEERELFDQRMRQYENAVFGLDGSTWLDGIGTHFPDEVLDAWERGIYESCDDHELKRRIDLAWRSTLGS